jgi:7,8-dihydro-6-hydroxymethylpterin-pyrophosphokinase
MPDSEPQQALLSLEIPTIKGPAQLRENLREIHKTVKVLAISSVYKKYANSRREDLNSHLVCVLQVKTELDFWVLNQKLKLLPDPWTLLAYGQLVSLTPELSVPNPYLFEDPVLLRCASEAWGFYEHPILGQCLNELVSSVHSFGEVEFFAQGRSVL